jgi:nucleotide-binding universal stress UspA family protein
MERFKNILTVYNNAVGDDDALNQATALARRNDARLTVIEVIKNPAASPGHIAERRKQLSRIAASIGVEGIKVATTISVGTPFLQIVRQVLRDEHDLVIMAAEGGGGFKHLFFGSTSMHLMRKCPCPIWIVNPGKSPGCARILAAVDPNPDNAEADELNIKILDLATSLGRLNESELHIFHAWELSGNDLDTSRSEMKSEQREQLLRKNELMHRKAIDRLLERYALENLNHHVHVVHGDPGFLLPEMAEQNKIDMIVMGTLARAGIPGFFIGNTAESVLHEVECAVLTVKPEGFVTPITLEE